MNEPEFEYTFLNKSKSTSEATVLFCKQYRYYMSIPTFYLSSLMITVSDFT